MELKNFIRIVVIALAFVAEVNSFLSSAHPQIATFALSAGDKSILGRNDNTIQIVGATGGVGRLVSAKIKADNMLKLKVLSRSLDKANEIFGTWGLDTSKDVAVANTRDRSSLKGAFDDASVVVISTGTTAFPSAKWKGGNNPEQVDKIAVENMVAELVEAKQRTKRLKRVVLVSSVGVDRTDKFPFVILNLFGVLKFKKAGEDCVRAAALANGFSYVILRPGQLLGEPFSQVNFFDNLKIAEEDSKATVELAPGDTLLGSVSRASVAEVVYQCLTRPEVENKEIGVVSTEGPKPSPQEWDQLFQRAVACS